MRDLARRLDLSKFTVSFLADDSLRMRYVSVNGQFRKIFRW